jgi:hypothetical protein
LILVLGVAPLLVFSLLKHCEHTTEIKRYEENSLYWVEMIRYGTEIAKNDVFIDNANKVIRNICKQKQIIRVKQVKIREMKYPIMLLCLLMAQQMHSANTLTKKDEVTNDSKLKR